MSDLALSSPFQGLPQATLPAPAVPKLATGTPAPSKLHQAAQDFEAIFLRQILAEARKSTMGDTLFSSDASSTFNPMQDARCADIAAGRDALGLAGMIERQLGGRAAASGNPPAGVGTKPASAGGTKPASARGKAGGA